jgi:uncharacterized protein YjbI with pentapeptide repeats
MTMYKIDGTVLTDQYASVEAAVKAKVSLAGADLAGAYLSRAGLTGANLTGAVLTGAVIMLGTRRVTL